MAVLLPATLTSPARPCRKRSAKLLDPMRNPREELLARARAAWPDFELDEDVLARHVEGLTIDDADRAAELFLACACAHGEPKAVAALERRYLTEVGAFV